jgi:hypothetical protein
MLDEFTPLPIRAEFRSDADMPAVITVEFLAALVLAAPRIPGGGGPVRGARGGARAVAGRDVPDHLGRGGDGRPNWEGFLRELLDGPATASE